jgi:hypothetical protein
LPSEIVWVPSEQIYLPSKMGWEAELMLIS